MSFSFEKVVSRLSNTRQQSLSFALSRIASKDLASGSCWEYQTVPCAKVTHSQSMRSLQRTSSPRTGSLLGRYVRRLRLLFLRRCYRDAMHSPGLR
jgi:hypothetical protein